MYRTNQDRINVNVFIITILQLFKQSHNVEMFVQGFDIFCIIRANQCTRVFSTIFNFFEKVKFFLFYIIALIEK